MRYSIIFLGIIATTSGSPLPAITTTDPCQTVTQKLLKPLANESAAQKFCAVKYGYGTAETGVTVSSIRSSNP
jgi:hypothetical protein